jgi:hypothetical protein
MVTSSWVEELVQAPGEAPAHPVSDSGSVECYSAKIWAVGCVCTRHSLQMLNALNGALIEDEHTLGTVPSDSGPLRAKTTDIFADQGR